MTAAHRRMAMIPEGSELIEYAEGRGPQLQFRNIFVSVSYTHLRAHET